MIDVLYSSPNSTQDPAYLPYVYAVLKSYCEQDETLSRHVRWHKPLYQRRTPETLLNDVDPSEVDVLGMSLYIWNWYLQAEIAKRIKAENPDCLVVAGGPNCDPSNPDFFRENPWCDLVVRQEGEEPFRRILNRIVEGEREFHDIPGLYLRDANGTSVRTDPPELLDEDDLLSTSPYREESELLGRMVEEIRANGNTVAAIFESNRGCPFHCSFCDWGQLTDTRPRLFDMERVREDLSWVSRQGICSVNIIDANLGMFERDVEIVQYICDLKEKRGAPDKFLWNATKSEASHLPEIMKRAHDAGLSPRSMFSFQHTDPDVLDAIHRNNLTDEELKDLIEFNRDHDIPVEVQLILGCPGDTYEKWKGCFSDLMEWGVHGEYWTSNFHVLPNSPAADAEYREKWGIEHTVTRNFTHVDVNRDTHVPNVCQKKLITKTNTFDEQDWIRMWLFTYLMTGLHNLGLTRKISLFLHHDQQVSFEEFYSALADGMTRVSGSLLADLYGEMRREKEAFLRQPETRMLGRRETLRELPDYPHYFKWDEWLFIRIVRDIDRFYGELQDFLLDRFQRVERRPFRDLVSYQKKVVVDPGYDPSEGVILESQYDWLEYFNREDDGLASSVPAQPTRYIIDQDRVGDPPREIRWHHFTGRRRLKQWIETILCHPLRQGDVYTTHELRRASSSLEESSARGWLPRFG